MQNPTLEDIQNQYKNINPEEIVTLVREKNILVVNPRRKNGIILIKQYHGEFAGPGSVIGSIFDLDVIRVLPVGKLSFIYSETSQERQKAYLIRRQWTRLIKQITDNPVPIQRAQVILNQFEHWFDTHTVSNLPDEAFALLVGVLPQTIRQARNYVDRVEL